MELTDPYLTPNDIQRISADETDCFIDSECHGPDSAILIGGELYRVRSVTAVDASNVPHRYADMGFETSKQAADALREKFPRISPGTYLYLHHVRRYSDMEAPEGVR